MRSLFIISPPSVCLSHPALTEWCSTLPGGASRLTGGVKNQRDSGVVISSQPINTRVYRRVIWRGSQNRLYTFTLGKNSRMLVGESGKTSAPSLLRGILIETEMIIARGSFISHERLNLKKLNIRFERKVKQKSDVRLWISVIHTRLQFPAIFCELLASMSLLLLLGVILTWAGRMGWLQEAHLGAKTLSRKATTTKNYRLEKCPLLFLVSLKWKSVGLHTHRAHFSRSRQVKTGKKKMTTTEAAAAGVERGHFATKEGLFTRHLARGEEQSHLTST